MKLVRYLIVRGNGDMRIVTRRPSLAWDEFAYRLNVTIPAVPSVLGEIELTVPEWPKPGEAVVTAEEAAS